MKTAAAKTESATTGRSAAPFFRKGGRDGLHAASDTPFFHHQPIQPKLTIGQPNDKYEKEADAMADQVVRRLTENNYTTEQTVLKTPPAVHRKPILEAISYPAIQPIASHTAVQQKCAACEQEDKLQKKEEPGEEEHFQLKAIVGSGMPPNDDTVQRACAKCGAEEQKLHTKPDTSSTLGSPDLESRLHASKGSGSPLPESTRAQMESSFGTDFSGVRVHTDSAAVQMNKELRAQAFTHGSDIYFNAGKFNPDHTNGQKLLAHELTHTVQQNGGTGPSRRKIQLWPDWVSDAADWVSDTASDAAGSVVEGAQWVGGQVEDGARWVGGKVAAGAEWAEEQISAAARWIVGQIRRAIDAGKNYLDEKWESVKEFGRTCFDDIKNGFGNLIHFVTTPLSSVMSALSAMNADLFGSVWEMVKTGANALWTGINSVIDGIMQFGKGIWNTVSGFMNSIFETIAGLFDNAAFDLLPDGIKEEVRSVFNTLRSLWNQVSSFWTDLWQRLTSTVTNILAAVQSFADRIINFGIGSVISMVRNLKEVYDYVTKFFADPRATIQPFLDTIAEKLNTEVPPGAKDLGARYAQENFTGGSNQTADNGSIQRAPIDSEDRTTATLTEVAEGILYYVARAWADLDIKQLLWQTVVNMFWPPATIRAIYDQFSQLWNDHWATTVDSLYAPRNFFDDPLGCLHDMWSNFLILLDFPLALWRTLNNVVGLLMGYITIIIILIEALGGAAVGAAAGGVGAIPGFFAGVAAGLATVAPLGEALMASYLLAESTSVVVILGRLYTTRQTCEKRQVDILTSVASFIAMAVALALQLLMALLAELVSLISNLLKGTPKPAPVPQPRPSPQPQPLPPPQPRPVPPPRPVPQPVPVRPAQPVQPAPPGGGQVIPFPRRPATPANPGRIAAKFEGGLNQTPHGDIASDGESTALPTIKPDVNQEPAEGIQTMPLSGVHVSENGILQTQQSSRREKINPDACEPKKNICYERSVTFNINRVSMSFIGINPTPDDLRIAACLLRTATGTTSRAFSSLNVAIGKFWVNNSFEYIPGVNIPRGDIHSEDMILIEARRRFGEGNYKLAALFSERVPCPRCAGNLKGTPLTPDCKIYCIINNDYDWRSLRRSYNKGVLF
ncbi:eCIS core domain-containing protein [Pontibacter russatus]|uniref:eCIS core domain-containing protein n=1 Tax=Pontibacter russatus TaxID=2694929 RepID=UPI001F238557|nr:DUF4157 domain-containing protein [Pontibacter russatus]